MTLGSRPARNLVVDVTESAVYVETERSRERKGGAEEIPAWMFNLAWDHLRTHGELANRTLLDELRVHRSRAVCAFLARGPGVRVRPGSTLTLEWKGKR
jgi:hypothetical protein